MTTRQRSSSEQAFDWLFDQSSESLLIVETETTLAAATIRAANSAALELHGIALADLEGQPYRLLLGLTGDASALQGAVPGTIVWHRNSRGDSFPVARRVSTLPWDDHLQLVTLTPVGIPGQPPDTFLHSQRLETLGMLAGHVAHDLNNVLVSILTDADLLVEELSPGDPIRERLDAIAIAGRDARALTRQLLGTATSAADRRPLDLAALVDETLLLFSTVVNRGVTTAFKAADYVPPVEGNAVQLRQAILNLLLNANWALRGTPGAISITTSVVPGSLIQSTSLMSRGMPVEGTSYAAIEIADTGEGMTPDVLTRAFEPFFTTRADGTGLGLSAVFAAVAAHNGLVTAGSARGEGSQFTIYLPLPKA
ncbi:MAG: PAS domain-containing protein [Dehalococcoidia bacterium]|nr:PAS domain-containing protein [Dehalococcoidia bacterium]MCA9853915.1 PAS domain-containing protein [Dehalococcoidia bacterium]